MKSVAALFNVLLLAMFAAWFGGFTFYVSFVVPIGTEVLGSSFDQGMITREVTVPLNVLSVVTGVLMAVDLAWFWRVHGTRLRWVQASFIGLFLLMAAILFWLHPQIDTYIDLEASEIVGDYDQFYLLHRLYLWGSTLQWLAAWGWLVCFVVTRHNDLAAGAKPDVESAASERDTDGA